MARRHNSFLGVRVKKIVDKFSRLTELYPKCHTEPYREATFDRFDSSRAVAAGQGDANEINGLDGVAVCMIHRAIS